jgi:WD40 repeat protein/tRNA A-37 threonylcarbamoyl transferase component Bud32/Flp pilus assembly protein TadD
MSDRSDKSARQPPGETVRGGRRNDKTVGNGLVDPKAASKEQPTVRQESGVGPVAPSEDETPTEALPSAGEPGPQGAVRPPRAEEPATVQFIPHATQPAREAAPGSAILGCFGDYELLEKIAQGGMGVVYKARHRRLQRVVALKMILAGQLAAAEDIQRFYTEAEAAAHLDHPGIVPIFEVGEHARQHYYAMGYVEGGSVATQIRERPLAPRQAAGILRQVAEAAEYAHGRGIVHRDLKPANILLDKDGHPKISDFGLAKNVRADSHLTISGQVLGTPSFMSPEQAAGKIDRVGPAADVYSLGATLYCLLTGRPPFQAANSMQTLKQVMEREPVPLRQLNAAVDRDLETICLKCLQKEPGRRYDSAGALALDLGHWLAGEPIRARPVGQAERLWRWCRRNPVVASLIGLAVFLLVTGTVVAWVLAAWARAEASLAKANESLANEANALSLRRLYVTEMNLAQDSLTEGRAVDVLRRLERQEPRAPDAVDLRGFEWYYLKRLCQQELRDFRGHTGVVWGVACSPNGRRLATASEDRTVRVWDVATGQEVFCLRGHEAPVWRVAFSPDGRRLASAGGEQGKPGVVKVWDAETRKELYTLSGHGGEVRGVAFSPDGRLLATGDAYGDGSKPGEVRLWEAESGRKIDALRGHGYGVSSVAFSPDGRWLASAGDQAVIVWDLHSRHKEQELARRDPSLLNSIAFSPNGRWLVATGSPGANIEVWETCTWQQLQTLRGHAAAVLSLAFGPGGRLASASADHTVRVWDLTTGQTTLTLRGHQDVVLGVAFSPDGRRLFSAGGDQVAKAWDLSITPECLTIECDETARPYGLKFSPDGRWVAAALSSMPQRTVKLWDAATGLDGPTLYGHTDAVNAVAFDQDGKVIASGAEDGAVRLWKTGTWHEKLTLRGHMGGVWSLAFSPDGLWLASGGADTTVHVWEVATGRTVWRLEGHAGLVHGVAFSPDGRWIASASTDKTVKLWDRQTGRVARTLTGHTGRVWGVAFSPDGRRVASASEDSSIRVWDALTGAPIHTLFGHTAEVRCVTFSPDGQRLASGGGGFDKSNLPVTGDIKIWDVVTGLETLTLRGHKSYVNEVAFDADGRRLASSSNDNTVRIWDATPRTRDLWDRREALSIARHHFAKGLSRERVVDLIKEDPTIDDSIRQHALVLAEAYEQAEVRRRAEDEVRTLFSKALLRPDVIETLRANAKLSEPMRREALAIAERFVHYPRTLRSASLRVVKRPGADAAAYALALRQAERAFELAPQDALCRVILGIAQYRTGKYEEAVQTLTPAEKLQADAGVNGQPAALAFLAMALSQLGRQAQARETLKQLRDLMDKPGWAKNDDARCFLAEAEAVLSHP